MGTEFDDGQGQFSDVLQTLASEFMELEAEYGSSLEESLSVSHDQSSSALEMDLDADTNPVGREDEVPDYEQSEGDVREQVSIEKFLADTCKCKLGSEGKPCCLSLSYEIISKCRNSYADLTHNELDLVVMSQIHYLRTVEHEPCSQSFRPMSTYSIHRIKICQPTFLILHRISHNRYVRIVALYKEEGLTQTVHGNKGKLPANTCSFEQVEAVKTYIENYARAHALPVPGRLPNACNKFMLLPSDMSKMFVYRKYKELSSKPVGKSKFLELWDELTPHVAVMKPSSDLCFTCQQNNLLIMKAVNMPEAVQRQRFDNASRHLERAWTERHYYRAQCKEAETTWSTHLENQKVVATMHYSFDFAQQVNFPFDSQQTGPAYFKTACKCGIFGGVFEGKSQQVNYLIDEAENPGKGADCTISLVHHYLDKYGCGEENLQLHADNCTGQNKNNACIQYLLWRVITGKHATAQMSFMLVGHTKFAPDRFFGLVKKRYRKSSVDTIIDIARVVRESTTTGQNIPQLIRSPDGAKQVCFFQWTVFLQQFFKSIPNILKYHCFHVDAAKPGVVMLKEYSDSKEVAINILKVSHQEVITAGIPNLTHIKGLDSQRQWYLYEQIRPFCKNNLSADFTCPLPTCPKPGEDPSTSIPTTSILSASSPHKTATKRKCSQCHQTRHTKCTCPGKST